MPMVFCNCSCLQIGLFAIPFVTIVGWIMGHPFSLGFDPFAGGPTVECLNTLDPCQHCYLDAVSGTIGSGWQQLLQGMQPA